PDGLRALIGTWFGELQWVDLESQATTTLVKLPRSQNYIPITATAISDDGELVAGGLGTGSILLYNCAEGSSRVFTAGRGSKLSDLRFARGRLLSAHNDGHIQLWDVASGESLQEFAGHDGPATAAAMLSDEKRILSGGTDDTVRIWDLASG